MKEYTTEEYIQDMIDGGYRSKEDFAPLKCYQCDSKNLDRHKEYYEGSWGCVEFTVYCKDCKTDVATWSYGGWDL
jgi:hypothetical protein